MDMPGDKPGSGGKPSAGKAPRPKTLHVAGHKIVFRELGGDDSADPTLTIDGVDVMLMREQPSGVSAPMLNMHAIYPTVEELARSLVVSSPVFLR